MHTRTTHAHTRYNMEMLFTDFLCYRQPAIEQYHHHYPPLPSTPPGVTLTVHRCIHTHAHAHAYTHTTPLHTRYNMEMLFTDFLCYRQPAMEQYQDVAEGEEGGHLWLGGQAMVSE